MTETEGYARYLENTSRLDRISKFEYNWNGYRAEPIDPDIIHRASEIIKKIPYQYQPMLFPTGTSKIQLEIESDAGEYFEVEISAGDLGFYMLLRNGVEREWPCAYSVDAAVDEIVQFYKTYCDHE